MQSQIRNLATCSACQTRQASLRTGKRSGKLTKESYEHPRLIAYRKKVNFQMTFEEASASYGDASAPKSE
jgi:hypothetical protein